MGNIREISLKRGEETRERVYNWFMANPCSTNQQASEALGLSAHTIGKHALAIRGGWRPAEHRESANG